MSGGKETPRQKMIGLMYLVLMAMLAMNVSKQIINAFVTLNDKFERNSTLTMHNNEGVYDSFASKIITLKSTGAPEKEVKMVEAIRDMAFVVKAWSRDLGNYMVTEAASMINETDPTTEVPYYDSEGEEGHEYYHLHHLSHIIKKDDYDTPTRLFVGDDHKNIAPRGQLLLDSLNNYRNRLCAYVATYTDDKGKDWSFDPSTIVLPDLDEDTTEFNATLKEALKTVNPEDAPKIAQMFRLLTNPVHVHNHDEIIPWIAGQFDHAPLVAAACIFTSLHGDVTQAEAIAIDMISSRAKVETFNFNKIEPLAFSSTSYINQGDSLGLKIMIAAYDSTEKMKLEYWIDDTTRSSDPISFTGNAGEALRLTGSVGGHVVVGNIIVKEKGLEKKKNWKFNYSVGAPNAAVAAADLAVLYRNWDNRIKVSASGYDPSSVSVSCSGCKGSLKKTRDGYYIAKAGNGKVATITVSAKTDDGKSVKLAAEKFRIFPLPSPKPYFAGQTFDKPSMKKGTASSATQIKAKLGDSPLNVEYTVTGFTMIVAKNGKIAEVKSKNGRLTGEMKAAIKKMAKGTSLTFVNISAKTKGGRAKPIGGLSFRLL